MWIDEAECQELHYPSAPSYDTVTLYPIVSNLALYLISVLFRHFSCDIHGKGCFSEIMVMTVDFLWLFVTFTLFEIFL